MTTIMDGTSLQKDNRGRAAAGNKKSPGTGFQGLRLLGIESRSGTAPENPLRGAIKPKVVRGAVHNVRHIRFPPAVKRRILGEPV
jgi:hypothetical protein